MFHLQQCEHRRAIQLLHVTLCFPCGTVLLKTKPICSKRMRRLVSVGVLYILSGGLIAYGITQILSGFPYGKTQHVGGMRSSIVSVIYYASKRFLCVSCDAR